MKRVCSQKSISNQNYEEKKCPVNSLWLSLLFDNLSHRNQPTTDFSIQNQQGRRKLLGHSQT